MRVQSKQSSLRWQVSFTQTDPQTQHTPKRQHPKTSELISVPSAYIGGLKNKGQFTYAIKTTPKAPKASKTMTVKVKVRAGEQGRL
jgi:hypothetical protein